MINTPCLRRESSVWPNLGHVLNHAALLYYLFIISFSTHFGSFIPALVTMLNVMFLGTKDETKIILNPKT